MQEINTEVWNLKHENNMIGKGVMKNYELRQTQKIYESIIYIIALK